MLVNKVRIKQIVSLIKRSKTDKLAEFHAEEYAKELRAMQEQNLQNLFLLCKEYDVRYICAGFTEIAGCEDKKETISNPRWGRPAIWAISKSLGIDGGCGNTDQYQSDMGAWFPFEAYGWWDLKEMRKLDSKEVDILKFNNVCEKDWQQGRFSYPSSYGFDVVTLETLKEMDKKYAVT